MNIKDANNNLNNSSSIEDDSDEPALPLSSKNCYVTLVQHDDEQNEYLLIKRLSIQNSNGDIQNQFIMIQVQLMFYVYPMNKIEQ